MILSATKHGIVIVGHLSVPEQRRCRALRHAIDLLITCNIGSSTGILEILVCRLLTRVKMLRLIDSAKKLLILAILLRVEQFGGSPIILMILHVYKVRSVLVAPSPLIVIALMMQLLIIPLIMILVLLFVVFHLQGDS